MSAHITAVYAAILGLLLTILGMRTLILRRRLKIAVGDGGNAVLIKAIRAHANFAEYVPIALLLVWFLELRTGGGPWIHVLGITLVVGRLIHARGLSEVNEDFRLRTAGMFLTFTVIISASLRILIDAVAKFG